MIEIDPRNELAEPTKRTAMGRFDHENVAFLTDTGNRVAFYMGDDGTPGCIYKFIPSRAFSPSNRAANTDLLDSGTLYVAKFKADGTGEYIRRFFDAEVGTVTMRCLAYEIHPSRIEGRPVIVCGDWLMHRIARDRP